MKTLSCVHFFMHMCMRIVCSRLSASERPISLIEAHRRPSTPRPHGIAAETHNNKYYTNLSQTTIVELITKINPTTSLTMSDDCN